MEERLDDMEWRLAALERGLDQVDISSVEVAMPSADVDTALTDMDR